VISLDGVDARAPEADHAAPPNDPPPVKPIQPEALLEAARDDRFRRISLVEYRRVSAWVKSMVDLNTARILDFGCGQGIAAASFAFRHPGSSVVGYDLSDVGVDWLRRLFQQQTGHPLPANLGFAQNGPGAIEPGSIDLIYAWSVLEHVDPDLLAETLSLLHRCLKPGGALFVSCDPLYYSPNGSHLYRYINSPWHHLLMSGDQLRRAVVTERARDADLREWQQFLSLNRITAPALTAALEQAGFTIQKRHVTRTDTPIPPALIAIFHEDVLRTSSVQLLAVPRAGAGASA
jgi:SAM-dependent methyltransferase